MSDENVPVRSETPPPVPPVGTLVVDAQGRIGEFRGEWCGTWSLRRVTGGTEWTVAPEDVRPPTPEQRLRAETARANARSRGEVL